MTLFKNSDRGSASVDDRVNLCRRQSAELAGRGGRMFFDAQYPDRDSPDGAPLTPAGRMGLSCLAVRYAAPVSGANNAYAANNAMRKWAGLVLIPSPAPSLPTTSNGQLPRL